MISGPFEIAHGAFEGHRMTIKGPGHGTDDLPVWTPRAKREDAPVRRFLKWRPAANGLPRPYGSAVSKRSISDFVLFAVTAGELATLFLLTPGFGAVDYIYIVQHLLVLTVSLTRGLPRAQDRSLSAAAAVAVSYTYPYAQVIYLGFRPGEPAWPELGFVLVAVAAMLSLVSLLTLGRRFGVRPALRDLATGGPYRLVRHPMYLSYVLSDIGYNLEEWNLVTVLMVLAGWVALLHRIQAEERILQGDRRWAGYAARVRYRLIPYVW
jgi:protein-S-isoprenylcysteine O-methyltransferase Ste14